MSRKNQARKRRQKIRNLRKQFGVYQDLFPLKIPTQSLYSYVHRIPSQRNRKNEQVRRKLQKIALSYHFPEAPRLTLLVGIVGRGGHENEVIRHIDEGGRRRGALGRQRHQRKRGRCRNGNPLGAQSKHVEDLFRRRKQFVAHDLG